MHQKTVLCYTTQSTSLNELMHNRGKPVAVYQAKKVLVNIKSKLTAERIILKINSSIFFLFVSPCFSPFFNMGSSEET